MDLTKQDLELQIKILFSEWVKLKNKEPRTKVRYAGPAFDFEEYEGILNALFDDWWSGGKYTVNAEKELAKISERNFGLLANSGSSANLLLMSAAKDLYFKDGDKILTLACGFPTTVNPIIQNRLVPKFVDIDLQDLNLSPEKLEYHLKKDKDIRGVFVAHTLGFKSKIEDLIDISRRNNVEIFFDNCDAYGTIYKDRPIQSYGKAATFSFYVAHHISMGEGGGIVTNDEDLHLAMRSFRNWGRYCASPNCCIRSLHPDSFCPTIKLTKQCELPKDYIVNYQYESLGYNLKPLELQSAMLLPQMAKISEFSNIRRNNYAMLYKAFAKYPEYFKIWPIDEDTSPFGFPALILNKTPFKRKHLIDHMTRNNVETRMLFGGNLTKHPAYTKNKGYWESESDLTNSDNIMNNFILFGVSQIIGKTQVDYIEQQLDSFIKGWD